MKIIKRKKIRMKGVSKVRILIFQAILLFTCSFQTSGIANNTKSKRKIEVKVAGLKCEHTSNPIGLDVETPHFSWSIEIAQRGGMQTAYQIVIADSPEKLENIDSLFWNSGKVISSKSVGIAFAGPVLESRKRYFWKVKIWDSFSQSYVSDEIAYFEMALMKENDWKADWIGNPACWPGRVLYFRYAFSTVKPIKSARAYISGIGYYVFHVNGQKVGDHVLDPGNTDYSKRVLYATYDITDALGKENEFGITVGPGWYGMPKLKMQAEITYSDGTREIVSTSKSTFWSVTIGPIVKSSIYDGEFYDAREEKPGCGEVKGKISNVSKWNMWAVVVATDPPGGKMVSQKLEPIKVINTLSPKNISEPIKGTYVIDAGQNIAGWVKIKVSGKKGTEISLKFAETLYNDGTVNQDNLYWAEAKDTYILKGEGEEIWEPSFTYHGFRYIQIEGYPYRPDINDIEIKVIRSAVEQTGKFSCSNKLLNDIHQMVVSTEASNLTSIPTDCPQRAERMGWLNDLTVRIEQAIFNFDLSRFYSKYLDDVSDTQGSDGSITDTAPFHWGNRPADPVSASYLLLALKSYEFYGNKGIILDHYEGLKAWVDYLNSRTVDGIVNYSYYGDWAPPVEFTVEGEAESKFTPGILMSTGYLYHCAGILSKMANIIGNENDASLYKKLAERTGEKLNNKFWNEQTGGYGSNNQACNSFALFLGLVDQKNIPRVVDNLVKDVQRHDYHLTTGNICTKYVLEMLTENGHADVAYKIASQKTYPSWGFMLANGATTLWERWENAAGNSMNSHNHPMMGSVDSWFYKYLVGITPNIEGPGFEKFNIHPYIIEDLDFVEGEFKSVRGTIKSAWRKQSGKISLDLTIPGNSTATVYIPTKNQKSITENNRKIDHLENVKFIRSEDGYAVFEVASGNYHFKSDW